MICLWNGKYEDRDIGLSDKMISCILREQNKSYQINIGRDFGDYKCVKIEYDWYKRSQIWSLKCNSCGNETQKTIKKSSTFQWKCDACKLQSKLVDYPFESIDKQLIGCQYEKEIATMIRSSGYDVKIVSGSHDFGVDLIALSKGGTKIAIQCKASTQSKAGVDCIQEVYAGGRYFDIEHFAAVSKSGFTQPAQIMAAKLGVYLSNGVNFDYPSDIRIYSKNLLITHRNNHRKGYDIDGKIKTLSEWCKEYNTNENYVRTALKKGLPFKEAIHWKPQGNRKRYSVDGITGTMSELCKHFNVGESFVRYRMSRGMTVEEAILTPKLQEGRPKIHKQIKK